MKKYFSKGKKVLALMLSLVLVCSNLNLVTVYADNTHWADDVLQLWANKGLIDSADTQTFRADDSITRAEFMDLINKSFNYFTISDKVNNYNDVKESDWYYKTVAIALGAGYIEGESDSEMNPNGLITREQAMAIMTRISEVPANTTAYKNAKDSDKVSEWAKTAVSTCINQGFISGNQGEIKPLANMTRAEAVVMLNRKLNDERTFALAGTYDLAGLRLNSVKVATADVKLQNAKVLQDLTITKEVGEGNVNLDNIQVARNLYAYGGGKHSLYFNSVRVDGSLLIRKVGGKVRIVATGNTKSNVTIVESGAILVNQTKDGKTFEKIEIPATFVAGSEIELVGDFAKVENSAEDLNLKLEGEITKLTLNNNVKITGQAKIAKIDNAKNNEIKVVTADGKTTVLDKNSDKVEVKDNKVSQYNQKPDSSNNSDNDSDPDNSSDDNDEDKDDNDDNDVDETTASEISTTETEEPTTTTTVEETTTSDISTTESEVTTSSEEATTTKNVVVPTTTKNGIIPPTTKAETTTTSTTETTTESATEETTTESATEETTTADPADTYALLDKVREKLDFDMIKGDNTNRRGIVSDLVLPTNLEGFDDVVITWESNNPTVITNNGKVTRNENVVEVKLTATLSKDGVKEKRNFFLVVSSNYVSPLFADGYPKAKVTTGGSVDIYVKLKEQPTQPVELFVSVLHNHEDLAKVTPEGIMLGEFSDYITRNKGVYYLTLNDTNEYKIADTCEFSERLGHLAFVFRENEKDFSKVTMIPFTKKVEDEVVDENIGSAPRIYQSQISINNAGNEIYICAHDRLDKNSIPDASAFSLNKGTVKSVAIVGDRSNKYYDYFDFIKLDVETSTGAALTLSYNPPANNPLKSKNGIKVEEFTNYNVNKIIPVFYPERSYITVDKKQLHFAIDGISRFSKGKVNKEEDLEILVDGTKVNTISSFFDWGSGHFTINNPFTTTTSAINVTIQKKNGSELQDEAGNKYPQLNFNLNLADITQLKAIKFAEKAKYHNGEIKLNLIEGQIEKHRMYGMLMALKIDGKLYRLQWQNCWGREEGLKVYNVDSDNPYSYYDNYLKPKLEAAMNANKPVSLIYDTTYVKDQNDFEWLALQNGNSRDVPPEYYIPYGEKKEWVVEKE